MKLITRRILFCFCIILFLISSPLVILYAFGFRYDFAEKKLMQTGIIYLTPNIQDNIKILINDKKESGKINIKGIFKKDFVLYNLMPKTYNIKIDKENYHRWEKNLVVSPGLITYAQPLLLPSDPKNNLIFSDTDIALWSISDKFKKIFYLKSNDEKTSANIYDFSKKTLSTFPVDALGDQSKKSSIVSEGSRIFFAPDGKKFGFILPEENNRIVLLNSAEKSILSIADFISNNKILDERWDDSSRYFLYLNDKEELNLYDTTNGKPKKILENILGFALKNENIYYLDRNNLFFYRSSINNPLEKQQLSYVPMSIAQKAQRMEILISAKNTLAVITPEKNLFIVDKNGTPLNIGNDIEAAIFSKDGENLVFNSSNEIFTYTLGGGQKNLVTRLSQKISNVSWYSDYAHIWYLANQIIKNIELDSRPTPNIIDFINIPKNPANIIYTDSNNIYYDQLENNALSIYQVEIQK
ncbi:MAG: hypothetical protein Q8N37_01020 [bacterium]|nr:hypothetical protein [bacterium]